MNTAGITGLKASTLRENLGSRYQYTNDAGIPARTGYYWDFEYVVNYMIYFCNFSMIKESGFYELIVPNMSYFVSKVYPFREARSSQHISL